MVFLGDVASGDLGTSVRAHRPVLHMIVERIPATFTLGLAAMLIAVAVGVPLGVSLEPGAEWEWHGLPIHVVVEDNGTFADRLTLDDRVRVVGTPADLLWERARDVHARVFTDPVVAQGRLELRWYLREQAMSIRTHRYGNLVGLGEDALGS